MQLNGNNPEGEAAWTAFLKDFYKHCQELGIWDITYISMDERDYGQLSRSSTWFPPLRRSLASTSS